MGPKEPMRNQPGCYKNLPYLSLVFSSKVENENQLKVCYGYKNELPFNLSQHFSRSRNPGHLARCPIEIDLGPIKLIWFLHDWHGLAVWPCVILWRLSTCSSQTWSYSFQSFKSGTLQEFDNKTEQGLSRSLSFCTVPVKIGFKHRSKFCATVLEYSYAYVLGESF